MRNDPLQIHRLKLFPGIYMLQTKNILAIIGSASKGSANLSLVKQLAFFAKEKFNITIYDQLAQLPHFNPEQSLNDTPQAVIELRQQIQQSDGVIICTPEYVFSIPSGLKNMIEWCVSTTVFSHKPAGLITASAHGAKGHEELQLIMRTIEAKFNEHTILLIHGIKGKIDGQGVLTDEETIKKLDIFIVNFDKLLLD